MLFLLLRTRFTHTLALSSTPYTSFDTNAPTHRPEVPHADRVIGEARRAAAVASSSRSPAASSGREFSGRLRRDTAWRHGGVRGAARSSSLRMSIFATIEEAVVNRLFPILPTWFIRLCLRWYLVYIGWQTRRGDVVVQQIEVDRRQRKARPVTAEVEKANEQLYANDPAFFVAHLGPRLKYSACEWAAGVTSLAEAETRTVRSYQARAGLATLPEGARVLELGCGWGSLSLENAERYPALQFVAFSNSPEQIGFVRARAAERGLTNLTAHVEDYADFADPSKSAVAPAGSAPFDAAVAIETVEHAQNIEALLAAVAARLKPGATFFVHSLLHQSASYLMDASTWMGRNFFSGGSMLALNSYHHLAPPSLHIADVVPVNGVGYSKTLLAWNDMLEAQKGAFVAKYGATFYNGFRAFYVVCAEAFAANNGNEFMCAYYTFVKVGA